MKVDERDSQEWSVSIPPGVDQLICDDGEPMETARHFRAMALLIETLELQWADRTDFHVGGNEFLYFSMLQTKKNDFRGPDVYVVLGTERRERKAWVLWEEDGKRPTLIIELTSESTAAEDRGRKKTVYERSLEVPYYILYDPFTGVLEGFRLSGPGPRYAPIVPNAAGRLSIESMGVELGVWRGPFWVAEAAPWLRWYSPDGTVFPTAQELNERERENAERERENAERERENAERERENTARERENTARERENTERERERADREAARAADLERRLTELRGLVSPSGRP